MSKQINHLIRLLRCSLLLTTIFGLARPALLADPVLVPSGLIAWWRADGNALDAVGAHHGMALYGIKFGPGKVGRAFDFDGASKNRISVPDSPQFNLTQALTIEGWIYPRQYTGMVLFRGDTRPGFDPYYLQLMDGHIVFSFDTPQNQRVSLAAPIQLNQWQHVAATLGRQGNMRIYINGALAAQTNTALRPLGELDPASEPAIGIGNHGGTAYDCPFNGLIDEIALYARALTPPEIKAIYDAGSAGKRLDTAVTRAQAQAALKQINYLAQLSDTEARVTADLTLEATSKAEAVLDLFSGEVALVPPMNLPSAVRIERDGNQYRLFVNQPGKYQLKLDLLAKIARAEPWNRIEFRGPPAVIASVTAQATGRDIELQLLGGTVLETRQTGDSVRLTGFLGADRTVALRWQSRAAEVARKPLVTAETIATASITPTVIKFGTQLKFDILQGKLPKLAIALPAAHALTRVAGDQIRDWQLTNDGNRQVLNIEFIRPLEKAYQLTISTEQTFETTPLDVVLELPQPLEIERETGALAVTAEDVLVQIGTATGLRRVNAAEGTLAAFRFSDRPVALPLRLNRIEPVIAVADRVGIKLEETRLLVSHALTLTIEKAGVYGLELTPHQTMTVTDVRGNGVEDWKLADGKLRVSFANRVLGTRRLDVQLEQPLKQFPNQILIRPLSVTGASKQTAQIGAASAPGIQLKTADLIGLREVPIGTLRMQRAAGVLPAESETATATPAGRTDELLAFIAEHGDWELALGCERLVPRIVADVFNLVTIGDGLVGGSATIRYGIINQGVQQFRVKLPGHLKNIEFVGAYIRRKEQADEVWTITLQDKVWAGYTLVITYDFQFDPRGGTLPIGGVHTLDTERETGSVAITTAANLELNVKTASELLRRIDEADLAAADRALITRPVLLAYRYTGGDYTLALEVKRYDEVHVLSAVADRTQLTTVLTEAGELLTQASFMVKNNDKQYQRFKLPEGATFWSCYVDNQPAKPERDGNWLLVPLPRAADRDKPFAVDIVYAENKGALKGLTGKRLRLCAPVTDVPNTYAEWQLYVPSAFRLASFGGNMTVVRGTVYTLRDAWRAFIEFYADFIRRGGGALLIVVGVMLLIIALVLAAWRRGFKTLVTWLCVLGLIVLMAAMLLPSLAVSKKKAMGISATSNLRQLSGALEQFALENAGRTPASPDELKAYLGRSGAERALIDPRSGLPFVYVGAGVPRDMLRGDSVVAYSPTDEGGRLVLFADGRVETVSRQRFDELARRGFTVFSTEEQKTLTVQDATIRAAAQVPRQPTFDHRIVGYVESSLPGELPKPSAVAEPGGFGGATPAFATPLPTAAGIRPIRIDIPRAGQALMFTKVLNVHQEPLWIQAKVGELKTFRQMRALAQVCVFVVGLFLILWYWRRVPRRSLPITIGVAMMLGAVADLLIEWRTLHIAFIIIVPVASLALIFWLLRMLWRRTVPPEGSAGHVPPNAPTATPPAVAILTLLLGASTAQGAALSAPDMTTASAASVLEAKYTGTVNERVAQLDATLRVAATSPNQQLMLFGDEVAVQQFSASSKDAKLVRQGPNVLVLLPRKGQTTLHLKLLVNVGGDATKRSLAFKIPDALTSFVSLDVDSPEVEIELPTAVWSKRTAAGQQTRIEALFGASQRVEMIWTPRIKRAAEIAATVFCQNTAVLTFGAGVMNTRAVLEYQIAQGELRQLRVRLPALHRLLRVEGESIRSWEVKDDAGPILVVELLKGFTTAYRLGVETETSLGPLPATVNVEIPHALDVKRETGHVGLRAEDELELSIRSAADLQRVDTTEFARVLGHEPPGVFNAFRFLKPEFALHVSAAAVQPQIEAQVHNHVTVGAEQLSIAAAVNYTIKRAGVFVLGLALPDGYSVETVSGGKILQWTERTVEGTPVLEITLNERTAGAYMLRVGMVRHLKELPHALPVGGVHPLDAQKLTGFVSVSADQGVALKTADFSGLTEIPVAVLESSVGVAAATISPTGQRIPISGSALSFKYIATEPVARAPWQLTVQTELLEPWVRAEVANTFTVSESLVNCRALVRYDIQNAPTKQLAVQVPASAKNVQISGPNIRRRDNNGTLWQVELQTKTRGVYTLTVTWEQPRDARSGTIELQGVTVHGVERQTGFVALAARPPLQVTPKTAADLLQLDTRDWPDWAGQAPEGVVLVYRYLLPGYKLVLGVDQFKEAEVLQALVDNMHLTTVVADDGQVVTLMTLAVRNNARQFVEIELPDKSTNVWSALVAGRAVRPSVRANKLLVPLERSGADGAPVTIELVYTATNRWPTRRGQVTFHSPMLDMPVKAARWDLYLPPDYAYSDFDGSMKPEPVHRPEHTIFSLADYVQQESQRRAAVELRVKSELGTAKQKLAKGSVDEAYKDYERAQQAYGELGGRELKDFGVELRRAQVSNLLEEQRRFVVANVAPAQLPEQTRQQDVTYEATVAEAQLTKLQQAQQAAAARVLPLRVTMPTHGLRLSFSQILQTQPGKPMTIEFTAVNTKSADWFGRILVYSGCFLVLWLLVAAVAKRPAGSSETV